MNSLASSYWLRTVARTFGMLACLCLGAPSSLSQLLRPLRMAVLDFGTTATGLRATVQIRKTFSRETPDTAAERSDPDFNVLDLNQSRAAAIGVGYRGSLNMTVQEAGDLGAAIGCDFYFLGDAQTVKRSPSNGASYFESFAAIFLVSARTGRLVLWERPLIQRPSPAEAENALVAVLSSEETHRQYVAAMTRALQVERAERATAADMSVPIIEVMSDNDSEQSSGVRAPRAYRRLKPNYPETAARAEVEATVDALVDIDAAGEVGRVEITRWAGYGLDESVIDTVRQMHFFPGMRNGVAVATRVLLRYNFRKPPVGK